MPDEPTVFEKEFSFDEMEFEDEPYTVTYDEKNKVYNVEGPRIEKCPRILLETVVYGGFICIRGS